MCISEEEGPNRPEKREEDDWGESVQRPLKTAEPRRFEKEGQQTLAGGLRRRAKQEGASCMHALTNHFPKDMHTHKHCMGKAGEGGQTTAIRERANARLCAPPALSKKRAFDLRGGETRGGGGGSRGISGAAPPKTRDKEKQQQETEGGGGVLLHHSSPLCEEGGFGQGGRGRREALGEEARLGKTQKTCGDAIKWGRE